MQSEFDDHIKMQVDGFKLSPSTQVWDLVEAQLPEKKRRRFIFWWWPLSVLLIGLGIYELVGLNKKDKNLIVEKTNVPTNKIIKKKLKDNLITNDESKKHQTEKLNKIRKENILIATNNYTKKKEVFKKSTNDILKLNNNSPTVNKKNKLKDGSLFIATENNKEEIKSKEVKIDTIENKVEKEKLATGDTNTLTDTIKNKSTKSITEINKKETVLNSNKKIKNKNNSTKVKWELIAAIGNSNTVGKPLGINNSSLYDASTNFSASPGNGGTSFAATLSAPTAGIFFGLNLQRLKQIDSHFAWFGSIGYRYLSNHQISGIFVDSTKIVGGSTSNNLSQVLSSQNDKISSYYKYGNVIDHYNYFHFIDLSLGLKYNVSKHVGVIGKMMVGYNVGSNWLQPDLAQSILYYSNKLTNKWNIGSTIGVDWQFAKLFSIGGFYNYNFSKVSAAAVQQNLHWQTLGATFSVQLPIKK